MAEALETILLPPIVKDAAARGATPDDLVSVFVSSLEEAFPTQHEAIQAATFYLAGRAGRLALLAEEGGCVTSADAAKLYAGVEKPTNPETVRRAARESRLIAVRDGHGELLFPVWQFAEPGGVLPGLARALVVLRDRPGFSEITPFRFFLQGHPRTEGRPLDALRKGNIEAVVEAARAEHD